MARQPITINADVFVEDVYRPGFTLNARISDDRNVSVYEEVFWEPRMGTVFLRPVQLTPEWSTTGTGDYARFQKAGMSCSDAGFTHWEQFTSRFSTDYFVSGKDPANTVTETITVETTLEANRGMFIEFFIYGRPGQDYPVLELGVGGYTFKLWTNSYFELWKSAVKVAWDYLNPDHRIDTGKLQRLMVLPLRRDMILFWAGESGSYTYQDPALDYANRDNVILPAQKPTIKFPSSKACFGVSYLTFATSGTIRGPVCLLPYKPSAAASYSTSWEYDLPDGCVLGLSYRYATDVDAPDPSTDVPFVCNGVHDNAYYYITIVSTTKKYSPTVYRVAMIVTEEMRTPYQSTQDITPNMVRGSMRVDEPGGVELELELKNSDDIEGIDNISNVQIEVREGDNQWFAGFTQAPQYIDGPDGTQRLRVKAMDWWKRCMNTRLTSEQAYDGMLHHEAIKILAGKCGFTAFTDIDSDTVRLPYCNRDDYFAFLPDNGTPTDQFMKRIRDEFSQFDMDTKPSKYWSGSVQSDYRYVFAYKNPSSAYPTLKATFDPTPSASGTAPAATSISREYIPPEGNEVWVIGFDDEENPIVSYYVDYDSQDSTIAPGSRPTNWVGERWPIIFIDPGLKTLTDVQYVCSMLSLLTTLARERVEFDTQWVPEATRHDWIFVIGYGYYQVESFEVEFAIESATNAGFGGLYRPTHYTAIRWMAPYEDEPWDGVHNPPERSMSVKSLVIGAGTGSVAVDTITFTGDAVESWGTVILG